MSRTIRLPVLLLAGLLAGCAIHQVPETVAPPAQIPESFSTSGELRTEGPWWAVFGDETLNELIPQALGANPDLRMAWARLKQAEALSAKAHAARFPEVSGQTGSQRGKTNFFGQFRTASTYNLGVSAAYEVDFWGRVRALEAAGRLDAAASRQDLEALAWTLSASVTGTWYAMEEQRELLALLDDQIAVSHNILEVLETRFTNGLASAVEVYQQREQLASVKAQIPPARARLEILEHQLAILSGQAPDSAPPQGRAQLPELPPPPATGLPLDLLRQRPDVQAAALAVSAADFRIGAAIANRYPALRLNAGAGYQANELTSFFSSWIWNLAANIAAPLFDGGSRKAEVVRARAVLEERVAGYEKAVLVAIGEVEDALVTERHQRELITGLSDQLALARDALRAGQTRYASGVGDFLTVLTEIQAVQRAERALIDARSRLVGNRIDLYRALGGDWTEALQPGATISELSGADE